MGLLANQPLSAAIGFGLTLFSILVFSRYWITGVLMLATIAYVAVPFTRDGDYVGRILIAQTLTIFILILDAIRIAWSGYMTTLRLRGLIALSVIVAGWIWIQRGAESKLWVISGSVALLVIWRIVVNVSNTAAMASHASDMKAASEITPDLLIKRDEALLEAMYKVAHGRPGRFVTASSISPFVHLTTQQVLVAVDRLIANGSIEENDYGYALKQRGIDTFERRKTTERKRHAVSNIFNFHGSASGVFGSENQVYGNKFVSGEVSPELIEKLLVAAMQLRSRVPEERGHEIDEAALDVRLETTIPSDLAAVRADWLASQLH